MHRGTRVVRGSTLLWHLWEQLGTAWPGHEAVRALWSLRAEWCPHLRRPVCFLHALMLCHFIKQSPPSSHPGSKEVLMPPWPWWLTWPQRVCLRMAGTSSGWRGTEPGPAARVMLPLLPVLPPLLHACLDFLGVPAVPAF